MIERWGGGVFGVGADPAKDDQLCAVGSAHGGAEWFGDLVFVSCALYPFDHAGNALHGVCCEAIGQGQVEAHFGVGVPQD